MGSSFAPSGSQDSFADLLSTIILFVSGKLSDGGDYWAYLAMKPSMAKSFMEAKKQGNFDLEDYGTIIEWGHGTEAPADVIERMRRDYGVDKDYERKLLEILSELL